LAEQNRRLEFRRSYLEGKEIFSVRLAFIGLSVSPYFGKTKYPFFRK